MDFNPNIVNIFLEASSKENLIKLQVMTNNINGKAYNYQTPYKDNKKWIVWFFADWQSHIYMNEDNLKDMMPEGKTLTDMLNGGI